MTTVHLRTCSLCEALCGLRIHVDEGTITRIEGDPDDVLSHGHLCPKAYALKDVHEDPDRLKRPLRRVGDRWETLGWTEALDEAARVLTGVQRRHGRDALATYLGNPTIHNHGTVLYALPLLRSLGTHSKFSATSLDQLPAMLASHLVLGHQLLVPVPDLDRCDLLVVIGANPVVSGGSLMTAGGARERLEDLRARGGRIVVIDPVRTATAAIADRHLAIRPAGDVFLLLGLLHTLFRDDAVQPGRFADKLAGLEDIRGLVADLPPARVAAAAGLPVEAFETLAAELAASPAPVLYGRVGSCVQEYGGLVSWLILVINTLLGRLDEPGGAMFARPAVDVRKLIGRGRFGRHFSKVRGLPVFSGELPTACLAEEIEAGHVRGLLTIAGNPALSAPNGTRLDAALSTLEGMVAIDPYLNETTRHATLILPPTFGLEHSHYDAVLHALAVRNTARYSPAVMPPSPQSRHDWQILLGLHARVRAGRVGRVTDWLPEVAAGPDRLLDLLLRTGPYGSAVPGRGLSLGKLRKSPHGVDLGALEPCLQEELATPSGRIELAPEPYLDDVQRVLAALSAPVIEEPGTVQLLGRRELASNNSWMHNSPRFHKGRRRCTLWLNPIDANGIADGQRVRLRSAVGAIEVEVELTDAVRPGVASLPHGWGHDRPGTRLSVAATRPGASLNDLTDDAAVDPLTGTAAFSSLRVRIEPLAQRA